MPIVRMHTSNKQHTWSDVEVPFVVPLNMPLAALADALDALGWRGVDLEALIGRNVADTLERRAAAEGKEYNGPRANLTGKDEVVTDQLSVFGSLRSAGHMVTWSQVCELGRDEFTIISSADEIARSHAAFGEFAADPQRPSTGSTAAVDGELTAGGN